MYPNPAFPSLTRTTENGCHDQAPATNTALSLKQRCEIALSGVIVQDLWALLATERERKQRMPKGMCQMAPQTRSNLQWVAMCAANICATKEDTWHPFQFGHALSEIHIEHMFGRYRGQYAHADLNARAYWNANARVARQQAAKLARLKTAAPALDKEPALSPAEFLGSGSCGSSDNLAPSRYKVDNWSFSSLGSRSTWAGHFIQGFILSSMSVFL